MFLPPLVIAVPLIWLLHKCYSQESKVTGLYQHFGVYSRFSAIIATSLFASSLTFIPAILFLIFFKDFGIRELWATFPTSAVSFFLFRLIYKPIQARCPKALRKKLLPSILITGFGIGIKILFFFLPWVWAVAGPKDVTVDGQKYLLYGSDILNDRGEILGRYDGHNAIMKREYD